MGFIFSIYMLTKYLPSLESGYFPPPRGTADFAVMLTVGVLLIDLIALLLGRLPFGGSCIIFMVLYVWSRKSPYDQISFFGFLFQAWHLPFVMALFTMLIGQYVLY